MYKTPKKTGTTIEINNSREGESIEKTIQRLLNNDQTELTTKEPIYIRPEKGVVYGTDIRGDKWEQGIKNTDKVTGLMRMSKEEKLKQREEELAALKDKNDPKEGSIQANPENTDNQ